MKFDVGYAQYSTHNAILVCTFRSLIDYDPTSSSLDDAVGEYFYIYKTKGDRFLLAYHIRGQNAFGAPALTAAEGPVPIPADVAQLLIGRVREYGGESRQEQGKQFDAIIRALYEWLEGSPLGSMRRWH